MAELVKHNVEQIRSLNIDTVVTSCAGCFRAIILDWPRAVGRLPFKVRHITQFLVEQLEKGKLVYKNKLNMKVTYHDPSHLGRHVGIFSEPRKILESIPGVKLVEMERTKEYARCCGAGGGYKSGFAEDAVKIGTERVKEALRTKADAIVSSFCKTNIADAVRNSELAS